MYKSLENSDREVININNYLAADTWDIQMPLSNADAGNYFETNISIIKLFTFIVYSLPTLHMVPKKPII